MIQKISAKHSSEANAFLQSACERNYLHASLHRARGLKFPSQGTLSPRADLLVEMLYLVLLCCSWMQTRAAVGAMVGQECRISPGVLAQMQRGDSCSEAELNVSHLGVCMAGKSPCDPELPWAELSPSPPWVSGAEV